MEGRASSVPIPHVPVFSGYGTVNVACTGVHLVWVSVFRHGLYDRKHRAICELPTRGPEWVSVTHRPLYTVRHSLASHTVVTA